MSQVEIRVNGREYRVTCEEGQEDRLQKIAAFLDKRVSGMSKDLGQIGDARLMLLSALTICDELFEARELTAIRSHGPHRDNEQKLASAFLPPFQSTADCRSEFQH